MEDIIYIKSILFPVKIITINLKIEIKNVIKIHLRSKVFDIQY